MWSYSCRTFRGEQRDQRCREGVKRRSPRTGVPDAAGHIAGSWTLREHAIIGTLLPGIP
jgi:hypothetical protein